MIKTKCNDCTKEENMIISAKDDNNNFYFYCKKCYRLYEVSHNKFGITDVKPISSKKFDNGDNGFALRINMLFDKNNKTINGIYTCEDGAYVYINDRSKDTIPDSDDPFELLNACADKVLDELNIKSDLRDVIKDKLNERAKDSLKKNNNDSLSNNNYIVEFNLPFHSRSVMIRNKEDLVDLLKSKPSSIQAKVFKVTEVPMTEFK